MKTARIFAAAILAGGAAVALAAPSAEAAPALNLAPPAAANAVSGKTASAVTPVYYGYNAYRYRRSHYRPYYRPQYRPYGYGYGPYAYAPRYYQPYYRPYYRPRGGLYIHTPGLRLGIGF
jgi:hypothetical protein